MTNRTELRYPDAEMSHHAIDSMRAYTVRNGQPSLIVLCGDVGTGKTWDACAIALLSRRGWLRFASCSMIHEYDDIRMSECHRCAVLILDDYGSRLTTGALARAFQLVQNREHLTRSCTIITTNLASEVADIDPRIASRMNQACIINYENMPDRRLDRHKPQNKEQ